MADTIPLKIYKGSSNGQNYYDLLPDLQATGSGYAASQYQEVTPEQFYQDYTTNPNVKQTFDFEANRRAGEAGIGDAYRKLTKGDFSALASSPYAKDPNTGKLTTTQALSAEAMNQAGVQFGEMKNIGTADKPMYVPANSPGAKLAEGVSSGQVSPTDPMQQFQASMGGDISKAQGTNIVPSAPNVATPPPTPTPEDYKKGFETLATTPPPESAGEAKSMISSTTPITPTQQPGGGIMAQLELDPGFQQLMADRAEYNNIANQSKSLVDTYQEMVKQANIPAINTELVNMKAVIDGTEDDIRNEVKAAGGFATESQVMALTSARNKQLIKNYNRLVDEKAMAMESINNMINLASQDRQFAMQAAMQKLQIDQQILEYRDRFVQNAREGYQNIINAVGYGGLYSMLENDPQALSLAEQTLGLGQGQLEGVTRFIDNANRVARFGDYTITSPYVIDQDGRTVVNAQTGEAYTSPEDFRAKTGTSLADAQAKGLIQPLGLTREEEQQQFENMLKLQGLEFEQQRIGLERQRVGLEGARVNLARQQMQMDIMQAQRDENNAMLKDVQSIIAANPNEWGKAADQIEAVYGKIETGSGIDRMLQAAYATPPKDKVAELSRTQNNILNVDSLLSSSGLNSAVGPTRLQRIAVADIGGAKDQFIGGVEQLRSQLNLDTLINAKARGATFGALSDQELRVLSTAGTKIGQWAVVKDGRVVGYDVSEKDFRRELETINNFAKLDFVLKGGNPEQVGMFKADDVWSTRNSDGTITKFDELKGL